MGGNPTTWGWDIGCYLGQGRFYHCHHKKNLENLRKLAGQLEEPTFLPRLLLLPPFATSTAGFAVAAMAMGRLEVGESSFRETADIAGGERDAIKLDDSVEI